MDDAGAPGAKLSAKCKSWSPTGGSLAAHDRSDGGLITTVAEMAFTGNVGVDLDLRLAEPDPLAALFAEELGRRARNRRRRLRCWASWPRQACPRR